MAAQTYVWDHQSYKGEPGGDVDAGGYANADTYDLYLSLIDWLLEQKAQEDAEFQRQIEEYTAQGNVCIHCGGRELQNGRYTQFPVSAKISRSSIIMVPANWSLRISPEAAEKSLHRLQALARLC